VDGWALGTSEKKSGEGFELVREGGTQSRSSALA
jgi:hypothetical protein